MALVSVVLCLLGLLGTAKVPSPLGMYRARVPTLVAGAQEITVVASRARRATISLRGLVHFDDEFAFEHVRGEWRAHFSPDMERLLRRYRCRMESFDYDAERDVARVTLRLPLLGQTAIRLVPVAEG